MYALRMSDVNKEATYLLTYIFCDGDFPAQSPSPAERYTMVMWTAPYSVIGQATMDGGCIFQLYTAFQKTEMTSAPTDMTRSLQSQGPN